MAGLNSGGDILALGEELDYSFLSYREFGSVTNTTFSEIPPYPIYKLILKLKYESTGIGDIIGIRVGIGGTIISSNIYRSTEYTNTNMTDNVRTLYLMSTSSGGLVDNTAVGEILIDGVTSNSVSGASFFQNNVFSNNFGASTLNSLTGRAATSNTNTQINVIQILGRNNTDDAPASFSGSAALYGGFS